MNVFTFLFYLSGFTGDEFVTQMLLVSLLFIPVFKKRKLFALRFASGWAVIIGLQWLWRLNLLPIIVPFNYLIIAVLVSVLNVISYKIDIWQNFFLISCIYGIQYAISCAAYVIIYAIMFISKRNELFVYYYVEMPVVTACILTAVYFTVIRRLKKTDEIIFNSKILVAGSVALILVVIFVTYFLRKAIWFSLDGLSCALTIALLFDAAIMAIGFMNVYNTRLERENTVLRSLLRKDEQRYEQAQITNEKIMLKYHDISKRKNQGFINYEEIAETEENGAILNSTYFTGNSALDVVLSEKALLCERLGIKLICTADGEAMNFIKPHHIYSFIGNALDNCVESVRNAPSESDKIITLSITRREHMCVIVTENYAAEEVNMRGGLPATSKPDKQEHGFGTRSMQNIVLQYGGNIGFVQEGDVFKLTATIPIPASENIENLRSGVLDELSR